MMHENGPLLLYFNFCVPINMLQIIFINTLLIMFLPIAEKRNLKSKKDSINL